MTPTEALTILNEIAADARLTRAQHAAAASAVNTLHAAISPAPAPAPE